MADVEIAVIGAGIAGSATAWALACGGHSVMVFEQFAVGHRRGSSHGASRIFRFSYPDPYYVRLAMEALPMWRELEAAADESLLIPTGGLDAGGSLDAQAAALRGCGLRFEVLSGQEAAARWPGLAPRAEDRVLFQPDGAVTRADAALRAFVRLALEHGATIREETPVLGLRHGTDGVEIETAGETVRADVAVVTAGGWARPLLAAAGIDLPVVATRQTVAYFWLEGADSMPTLVDWSDPIFYALASPGRGLKVGLHHSGPVTDPSDPGGVDPATIDALVDRVVQLFPEAEPEPNHTETCIYTSTEDEHFILERHGNVVVGSVCSGHGFKFAPLTGRRLAALATEEGHENGSAAPQIGA
jgi:sarcosine oxidase